MIITGNSLDVLKTLPSQSINCCVTSPPYYGLRDYGVDGQIGLEHSVDEYVDKLSSIFTEVHRVLRDDGTLWLNLGDSYAKAGVSGLGVKGKSSTITGTNQGAYPKINKKIPLGLKAKDLIGIPWRVAFRLQQDGWYLRQDIVWSKPNVMPESVTDRCTKSHEYIFLLSKSPKYYFDNKAIKEPCQSNDRDIARMHGEPVAKKSKYSSNDKLMAGSGSKASKQQVVGDGVSRNKRSVWTVTTKPFKGAHFATFPKDLITPCILAGCPVDGTVLDPFLGSGTTGLVAMENNRKFVGVELNPEYVAIASHRIAGREQMENAIECMSMLRDFNNRQA